MHRTRAATVAGRFAGALDADGFLEASRLLAEDCSYQNRGDEIHGRERVMQSFIGASAWAHSNLESVTYEHSIDMHSETAATIRFVDIFEHGGRRLVHACLMHVEVGDDSLIRKLRLEEFPGEEERVSEFLDRVGVKRPRRS